MYAIAVNMINQGDYVVIEDPLTMFYNDIPADEAAAAVAALESFSAKRESPLLSFSACSKFPSWYILGERDNIVTAPMADAMINGMKQLYPGSFDVVVRLDTGHSPFLNQPEVVGKILMRAAKEL
jgi:pimeloyl-ACP methyl ester carboxylesterase